MFMCIQRLCVYNVCVCYRDAFGDTEVDIELSKKEVRGGPQDYLVLGEFIDGHSDP